MSYSPSAFIKLLERTAPGFETQCQGASSADLRALASVCARGLPSFYEWFLSQFGEEAGPLTYPRFDFSIGSVLAYHREEEDLASSNAFVIAVGRDPLMPQEVAYDLSHRTLHDARVTIAGAPFFDSLEAMLAWGLYEERVLSSFTQRCRGLIRHNATNFHADLEQATTEMGFAPAFVASDHDRLLDGQECAMTLSGNYYGLPTTAFDLATPNPRRARELLGQLAADHGFELVQLEWEPPLP